MPSTVRSSRSSAAMDWAGRPAKIFADWPVEIDKHMRVVLDDCDEVGLSGRIHHCPASRLMVLHILSNQVRAWSPLPLHGAEKRTSQIQGIVERSAKARLFLKVPAAAHSLR